MARANTDLRRRIASGDYVVDPRAVAEAMLRRYERVASGPSRGMPVSAEMIDRLAARPKQDDPAAGRGAA